RARRQLVGGPPHRAAHGRAIAHLARSSTSTCVRAARRAPAGQHSRSARHDPGVAPAATDAAVLADLDGLPALARSLVHGDAQAEVLLQDTGIAALEHPPATDRPVRPWLAAVLRNRWRMDRRGDARRRAREDRASSELARDGAQAPAADELLERARLLERL